MRRLVPVLAVAAVLAGCSSEPSEADIRGALDKEFAAANEQVKQMAGGLGVAAQGMSVTLHSMRKVGCKKASDNAGYNCDVEIDASMPMVGRQKSVSNIRLVKDNGTWRTVQAGAAAPQ